MRYPDSSIQPLLRMGYTEREAQFLYLVAAHSGHFLRGHYGRFLFPERGENARGATVSNLIAKLLGKNHAKEYDYGRKAKRYHLHFKPFYRAIGQPDSRNRRADVALTVINERMGGLDFVIDTADTLSYFESVDARVQHFRALGIGVEELPAALYPSNNGSGPKVVYFVDKCPLGIDEKGELTFTYCDDETLSLEYFETHLRNYVPLFRALKTKWKLVFISPVGPPKTRLAQDLFERIVQGPAPTLDGNAERYFRLKKLFEAEAWGELTKNDYVDRIALQRVYETPRYRHLYKRWLLGLPAQDPVEETGSRSASFSWHMPRSFRELEAIAV